MALYTSYDIVGKKEDISDVISNISPTKTPFQSMIGGEKVNNVLFQWQEDALAAVNSSNAQLDGFTASDATLTATTMRTNYTQILAKTIKIAETTDAVSTYGRAKETAYQLAKASAELKRDLENAFVGTKQTAVAGSSSTARKFAGFQAQVDSSLITLTGSGATAPSEANFLTALQAMYTQGVDPSIAMVTPTDALIIADFAKASGRYREIQNDSKANKTLVNAVDLYVSPFGEVKIVLNRFLATGDSLIFDPPMWKQQTLRGWTRETLAKDGDYTKMMIVGEFSLKHKNYFASAIVRRG